MRATAKGNIIFGFMNIPIKLYSTGNSGSKISFTQLDKRGRKVKQKLFDADGSSVNRGDLIKGFEYSKGKYITFTEEEIETFVEPPSPDISVVEVVPLKSLPNTYIDSSFYVIPDNGGDRSYRILSAALKKERTACIAKWNTRGKQYLVAFTSYKNGLVMHRLFYHKEVNSYESFRVTEEKLADHEIELGIALVKKYKVRKFKPESFVDEMKSKFEAYAEKKIIESELRHITEETGESEGLKKIIEESFAESAA